RPEAIAAPLVLSAWTVSWGGDDVADNDPGYLARLREIKTWLFAHEKVVMARYGVYEPYPIASPGPHPLTDVDGNLNPTGRVYAEVTGRIAGPKSIRPRTNCAWLAERTGGSAPFTSEWLVTGKPGYHQGAI